MRRECPTGWVLLYRPSCGHHQAVPKRCHSVLCPDCERERAAKNVTKWSGPAERRHWNKLITFTEQSDQDPARAVRSVKDHMSALLDTRLGTRNRAKFSAQAHELIDTWSDQDQAAHNFTKADWHHFIDRFFNGLLSLETKADNKPLKFRDLLEGIASLEMTYSAEHGYHAHIHVLARVDAFLPQPVLMVLWEHATKGAGKVVHITKAHDDQAIRETLKYTLKGWELAESQDDEILDALRNVKRTWRIGDMRPDPLPKQICPNCGKDDCHAEHAAILDNETADRTGPMAYRGEIQGVPAVIFITRDMKRGFMWDALPLGERQVTCDSMNLSGSSPGHGPPKYEMAEVMA